MKSFVVEFSPNMRIMEDYETIIGKTAKDAIEKRFGKPVKRVRYEDAENCDFIVTPGTYDSKVNIIHRQGNRMCFNIL